jgi:hypothetical protein
MLTAERFPRLLRQANDAELADVRKLGEDEYEVSLHPTEDPRARSGVPSRQAIPAPAGNGVHPAAPPDTPAVVPAPRFGVRSRPGAKPLARVVPLVGAVSLDDEPAAGVSAQAEPVAERAADGVAPKRPRRGAKGAKAIKGKATRAAAADAVPAPSDSGQPTASEPVVSPAPKPRRPRRPARKAG